jgi:hypothetical protein
MKKIFLFLIALSQLTLMYAQKKETFDLFTFTAPTGWKKEIQKNLVTFTQTDNIQKTWCVIGIIKSTASSGSIDADLESEWKELVVKQYDADSMEASATQEADGWKIKAASGKFMHNKELAAVLLTTFSGYNRCISILATTNSQQYLETITDFIGNIDIKKPESNTVANTGISIQQTDNTTQAGQTGSYTFSTTNFDDGWTSTVQEDWVEVTKGNLKVLLHYPKEGTIFPADPDPLTTAAWNILVAPRYSNLKNYKTTYITTYNRPYLGMGTATENASGKQVFVLLFRQGETGWLEFIAPDKNTFIQNFGLDPEAIRWDSETDLMKPLAAMVTYNKFAVAASDFTGTWTSSFSGMQQLYHVYTGNYAGMNINQSNEEFVFGTGGAYNWKLLVVNGMVENMKYNQVKSEGKLTPLNNWQVNCSSIEGKPKKYHAHFSCIKGARLLHLLDADFPGSGIYTVFGKK